MKVFVQGLWHCGSVISASLAKLNHEVIAYDRNKKIILKLKKNISPVYEPNLNNLIKEMSNEKKLFFSNKLNKLNLADIIWFAYDTPVDSSDKADPNIILKEIKKTLKKAYEKKFVIISSQLPIGTTKKLEDYCKKVLKKKFYFFYCPENLRLGKALDSFMNSERLIIGYREDKAKTEVHDFFSSISNNLLWMKIESAEMTKHAINSFLANSISFINEIATISEHTNADAKEVEEGLKSEPRIGRKAFLSPGNPFSGGTLGRDLNYLGEVSNKLQMKFNLLNSIFASNENHKKWIFNKLEEIIKRKKVKNVLIWGLTYTNNTDTLRRSFAVEIAKWLKNKKIKVSGFDPKVKIYPKVIKKIIAQVNSPLSKIKNADVLIVGNGSHEFINIKGDKIKKINKNLTIIDPNNYCKNLQKNFKNKYIYVGKPNLVKKEKKLKFNYNFNNKVVLITGASKGLGFEISKSFLKYGANLIICSRNYIEIKKTFKKLNKLKKRNQKIIYSATDISLFDDVKKLINISIKKFKKIDVLVNNAGIYGPKGSIEKINFNEFIKTININLLGSIYLCRELIPHFKKRNSGKIIQLSGGGATSPLPFINGYAVSKAAIVRFIENLSQETKNYNIDINSVAPGPLNTGMLNEVIKAGPQKVGKVFFKKSILQKKNGGTPFSKVNDLILFLGSSYSNGVSGKLISALWDDWNNWINYKDTLRNSDIYTLRRVTGLDRGYSWGDK